MPVRRAFLFPKDSLVNPKTGEVGRAWRALLTRMLTAMLWVEHQVDLTSIANIPPLDQQDEGYVIAVDDYNHVVRWNGTAWAFAPGDTGNRFFRIYPAGYPPQEQGWQLCNGATTSYLVVGGPTLQTALYTTPVVADQYFRR